MRTAKELIQASKAFTEENRFRSWYETLLTVALAIAFVLVTFQSGLPLVVRIATSIISGLLYVRLFVIYHDYQHRAILQNSWTATQIMRFLGAYLLAPENIWKRSHEHHHNNNSKLTTAGIGSYPTISKARFLQLRPEQKRLYLVNRHPLTIFFGYITLFIYWLNVKSMMESPRKSWDSILALAVHFAVSVWVWITLGPLTYALAWAFPFFLAFSIGAYLFYCQHNFPGAQFRENQDWQYDYAALHSTSYMEMNPVMQWFTANIGYHHVHHLNSRIPFYRLMEAQAHMPELQNPLRTTWRPTDVARCLKLKLWDPEQKRMITLAEIN